MLKTVSSITNAIGALNYKGTWNANTNSPALASGVGTKGDYYVVSVAGTTTLDGISNWGVGDWAAFNGAAWQRVEGGADLNGVNLTFTGTASGPTYETSNLTTGATLTDNSLSADGTDTNIDLLANPKGTGGFGINGAPAGVVAGAAFTSKFCVKNENSSAIGGFVQANNTTAASGSGIFACRSRGTLASPTVVQSGDNLASLFFLGNDGTDLAIAAVMQVDVDGTPGNNDMPGRIVFKTTPDGSEIPVEAMRIHKTTGVSIGNTTDPGATNLSVTGAITTSGINTPNTFGYKNLLINAGYTINQRVYVSAATLASGAYGHDRWKAGASGGNYTFTQLATSTTITIASGKSLIQVVEDKNVNGTSFVLSWTGTAQARYAVNSATPSGSYAASPIIITGQTVGTTMSVEFNEGTLSKPQLELGAVATSFDVRDYGTELMMCQRYFEKTPGPVYLTYMNVAGTQTRSTAFFYKTTKRANPTVTLNGNSEYIQNTLTGLATTLTPVNVTTDSFWALGPNATLGFFSLSYDSNITISAEL
jgi:hypothetical protein